MPKNQAQSAANQRIDLDAFPALGGASMPM